MERGPLVLSCNEEEAAVATGFDRFAVATELEMVFFWGVGWVVVVVVAHWPTGASCTFARPVDGPMSFDPFPPS